MNPWQTAYVGDCSKGLAHDGVKKSREHILAQWLAEEIEIPNLNLKHYLHDSDAATDELLRSHGLDNFVIRTICTTCNNGWMRDPETRAKPFFPGVMNIQVSLLQLQKSIVVDDLPWHLFRQLAENPQTVPADCFVLAVQLRFPSAPVRQNREIE